MDTPKELSPREQFVEANKVKLGNILEASRDLGAFKRPAFTVTHESDGVTRYTNSDHNRIVKDDPKLSFEERLEILNAEMCLVQLVTLTNMSFTVDMLKQGNEAMLNLRPSGGLDRFTEGATYNHFTFTDSYNTPYSLTHISGIISGIVNPDERIPVESVDIETADNFVKKRLAIENFNNDLSVTWNVSPVQDELLSRLTAKLIPLDGQDSDTKFAELGTKAMLGLEKDLEKVRQIGATADDPELQQLCRDLVTRGEASQKSRGMGMITDIPTAKELSDTLAVIGKMHQSS